ncbi:MAG: ADP-ribosylglycohydrolase family protein, partial [Deltaproteobacteria bacterium]|nr:ADP-ribosylglycohydrolase family protein [Deltaproteobacteria bacterium]
MAQRVHTSETDPIYVDWLPSRYSGRMGLTIAPGKQQRAPVSGTEWQRDLGADLERLASDPDHRASVLVSLLEPDEYAALGIAGYREAVLGRGFALLELPIADGRAPGDEAAVRELVGKIDAGIRAGERVVVHCAGGLGRSGTVAGCVLVWQGYTADEALVMLAEHRSEKCPETDVQRAFVRAFAHQPSPASRIRGAVLGAAIGDAMGNPTEFLSLDQIRQRYGPAGVTGYVHWWPGEGGSRFAPYTDDTQLGEVVLRSLCESRDRGEELDAAMERVGAALVGWKNEPQGGHRAPGASCLAGAAALERGSPWREAGGEKAGGCGSVMRAYPFGLVFADDEPRATEWAAEHSRLTHRDPIALGACAAMAAGIVRALAQQSTEEIVSAMVAAAERHSPDTARMIQLALDEARGGVGPEVTLDRLRGWAAHEAISAAAYVFARHADDPRAAILEGANTPGDSDSIATLAGALTGARAGVQALPHAWIRDLERSGELTALAWRAADP